MSMNGLKIFLDDADAYDLGFKVKVIGIGGGAMNIINQFQPKMNHRLEVIGVDTNRDSLTNSKVAKKFCLSSLANDKVSDFEMAWEAGRVRELVKGTDLAIIVTCLGSETGERVAPFVANICKEEAELTVAFATTPFAFESERRHKKAKEGLKELEAAADVVIHIPMNDSGRLFPEMLRTSDAFALFDKFVAQCVRGFYDSLYNYGMICCDLSDAKVVFHGGGKGYAAIGCAEGEGRIDRVLKAALGEDDLLLGGVPLKEAKSVWMFIEGGENLRLNEAEQIVNYVCDLCGDNADVMFALAEDKELEEQVRLTILTSGYK